MYLKEIELIPNTTKNVNKVELYNSLIIPPGQYDFYNYSYDLNREGLYRFSLVGIENQQRIVYKNDIDAILSGISWISSHGNSDNNLTDEELTRKATTTKLYIECGRLSLWAQDFLNINGIKSRIVASKTMDAMNTYDNGHVLIEIYRDDYNKWILYDLDNNAFFKFNNTPLSFMQFVEIIKNNLDYEIVYISSDSHYDISNFKEGNYNYDLLIEKLSTDKSLKQWYKRVLQKPTVYYPD
jgi:hypothetical protein